MPCVMRENCEIGGKVCCGRGEGETGALREIRRLDVEEAKQVQRGGPPHCEGFDDELASEPDSFHLFAGLEVRICA